MASVLWALESGARMRQSMTVTQKTIQSVRFSGFTCHALDWKNYRPLNSGIVQIVGSSQKTKESHQEYFNLQLHTCTFSI